MCMGNHHSSMSVLYVYSCTILKLSSCYPAPTFSSFFFFINWMALALLNKERDNMKVIRTYPCIKVEVTLIMPWRRYWHIISFMIFPISVTAQFWKGMDLHLIPKVILCCYFLWLQRILLKENHGNMWKIRGISLPNKPLLLVKSNATACHQSPCTVLNVSTRVLYLACWQIHTYGNTYDVEMYLRMLLLYPAADLGLCSVLSRLTCYTNEIMYLKSVVFTDAFWKNNLSNKLTVWLDVRYCELNSIYEKANLLKQCFARA